MKFRKINLIRITADLGSHSAPNWSSKSWRSDCWSQQDHIICKEQRPDPKVTKLDPRNTMATSRNSVHNCYEQNWWQRATLAESLAHWKQIWLTTGNVEQAVTLVIQRADGPYAGSQHPKLPETPQQDFPRNMIKCLQVYKDFPTSLPIVVPLKCSWWVYFIIILKYSGYI